MMICQVLCIALFACSFVQAAPAQDGLLEQIPKEVIGTAHKVNQAATDVLRENYEKFQKNVQSVIEAGSGIAKAGKESVETGAKLLLTGPALGAKVVDNAVRKDESNSPTFDGLLPSFS